MPRPSKPENDVIIAEDENFRLLYDVLKYQAAWNEKYDAKIHDYIVNKLKRFGYYRNKLGKNVVLESKDAGVTIQFSFNSTLKRWLFTFTFDAKFDLGAVDKYIRNYILNFIRHDIRKYVIKMDGGTELSLDIKNMDLRFIENIEQAIHQLRDKSEFFGQVRIKNSIVKYYLKNKEDIRLEVKVGDLEDPEKFITDILEKKEQVLCDEIRHEIYFQVIFGKIKRMGDQLDQLGTNIQGGTTIQEIYFNSLINFLLKHQERFDSKFARLSMQVSRGNNTLDVLASNEEKLIDNQTLLINNIQLLQTMLVDNIESIFHQNRAMLENQERIIDDNQKLQEMMTQNFERTNRKIEEKGVYAYFRRKMRGIVNFIKRK